MANQGARLLSDGVARRPLDIDAAAIMGGLFPRWQGGPMFQADKRGLLVLRADLRRRAEAAPQIYAPDALFDRLISEGRDFAALNRA
jgi:3-hydroxyacyl-CoA dehydrogenase